MEQLTQTITSNEVADMIGKEHSKLIRDIRTYIGYLGEAKIGSSDFFIESTYKSEQNKDLPNYLLTKQGCELVSNKLTGAKGVQFTAKYVSRFNQMEKSINQHPKIATTSREQVLLVLQASEDTNQRVDELDDRVTDLEGNTILSAGDYGYISRRINQRVAEVVRGLGNLTQEQRGRFYRDINSGVKAVTGVLTRTQLRQKHFKTVILYINDWEPSTATKMQVRQMSLDLEKEKEEE